MNTRPLTIEFTGLPNSGKTTLILNLANNLQKDGFEVKVMQENAELVPKEIPKKTWIRNSWITFGQLQSLLEIPYSQQDIILLDRGYYDALFWAKFLYKQNVCSKKQSESLLRILDEMNESFNVIPDYLFIIDVSIQSSLKRRYAMGGECVFTNKDFLSLYKNELELFCQDVKCRKWYLDTSELSIIETTTLAYNQVMGFLR